MDQTGTAICEPGPLPKNSGICVEPPHPGLSLHLGSGRCSWPGWVNIDGEHPYADIRADIRRLTYADNLVDRIAAIHVLEHVYEWEAKPMLTDWHRMLTPGGELILELPCMDKVFSYITRCMNEQKPMWLAFTIYAFYGDPRHQSVAMTHKYGWTMHALESLLVTIGFARIRFEDPHYHFPDRDMRCVAYKGA